jgi:CelD/BcsL family acetyltransferase involved in cellulose biosynthesis
MKASVLRPVRLAKLPEMLHTEVLCDAGSLREIHRDWDNLAVELKKPFCCPAWMVSWWRHVAPSDASLRSIAVFNGGDLIGVAPFYAQRRGGLTEYQLLAGSTSARIEPLARYGRHRDVASVVARTLPKLQPRPTTVSFEGIERASRWPALLTTAWPSRNRPVVQREMSMPAPTLSLYGSTFEEWWQRRGSHFKREFRRRRRRLEGAGAIFRLAATDEEIERGLTAFASMHYDRWRWRGGSMALNPMMEAMLKDAARELVPHQRFRLWQIEIHQTIVSAQLFVGAGGELSYWLGGFDDAWSTYGPSIQAIVPAIEHAWSVGDERIDFGAGGQSYKYAFADGEDAIHSVAILPPGPYQKLTLLQRGPSQLVRLTRERFLARLPQEKKDRLKRALRRLRR